MFSNEILKLMKLYEKNSNNEVAHIKDIDDGLVRLFLYYQYYNANEMYLDDLENDILVHEFAKAIKESDSDDDTIDIINYVKFDDNIIFGGIDELLLKKIDDFFVNLNNGDKSTIYQVVRRYMIERNITLERKFKYIILTDTVLDHDQKSSVKEVVTNFRSRLGNLSYVVFFPEDIKEFVQDIDSPSLFVKHGTLTLTDKDQFLYHGQERSMVTSISAKSLKDLYVKYGNSGLFTSNLRYYVKSAKIDTNIKYSIQNDPSKFWYFNNGLIITCENYTINDDKLELYNFSIVNGGQTTNIIGNTNFDEDFSIICKVIKPKYSTRDENTVFLSKVAETSNTQKPIKIKDIIANRIEQTRLKEQMASVGVFVQVKRGEKINKNIYPDKWQNSTNEEIGQMLFSFMYQQPGIARNSKSKMLENENYYNIIYKNEYNTFMILSLQHFKVGYHNWLNHVKKTSNDTIKQGLSRNGFFIFLAVFGLLSKTYYNRNLREYFQNLQGFDSITDGDVVKSYIQQNDIGKLPLLKEPSMISDNKSNCLELFDFIYDKFIRKSYDNYKLQNLNSAYSNFTKTDSNYYKYIIPNVISLIQKYWIGNSGISSFISKYLNINNTIKVNLYLEDRKITEYKPGLMKELVELRRTKFQEFQGEYDKITILSNNQISKICHYKPRKIEDLYNDCNLSKFSVFNLGEEILSLVEKYLIE